MIATSDYIIVNGELYHYGVKGMKWGVRRSREELDRASSDRTNAMIASRAIISGHKPSPKQSTPNSITDHTSDDGEVTSRTFYDAHGMKKKDIHTTDHGNPKHRNFGGNGEHVVIYEWNNDGSIKKKLHRPLTERERKENSDIL